MSFRRFALLVVKGLLVVALLAYLVHVVEVEAMREAAASAGGWWIVAAALILPVNLLLENEVWRRLAGLVVGPLRRRTALASLLAGYALGFFTPARAGELAGRAFYLRHPDKWQLSAVVFTHRLFETIVAVDVGLAALLFAYASGLLVPRGTWIGVVAFGVGAAVTLTPLLLSPSLSRRLLRPVLRSERIRERLAFLFRMNTSQVMRLLPYVAVRYAGYTTQFWLLVHAFAPEAPAFETYAAISLVFFAKFMIPSPTLIDVGVREGAAVLFLGLFGVPEAAALNAALLIFILNITLPAVAGAPLLLRLRLGQSDAAPAGAPPLAGASPRPDEAPADTPANGPVNAPANAPHS